MLEQWEPMMTGDEGEDGDAEAVVALAGVGCWVVVAVVAVMLVLLLLRGLRPGRGGGSGGTSGRTRKLFFKRLLFLLRLLCITAPRTRLYCIIIIIVVSVLLLFCFCFFTSATSMAMRIWTYLR